MTDEKNETKTSDDKSEEKASTVESKEIEKTSDEDLRWRAKYKMSKFEFEEFKVASDKEKKELLSKHEASQKANQAMQDKLIDAKIEAQAVAAGIKDLEFLKLMDKSTVKLDEKGEVQGAIEAINALKTRKPELFGTEKKSSSSTNARMSTGTSSETKPGRNAWDIPKEEWKNRRAFRGDFR